MARFAEPVASPPKLHLGLSFDIDGYLAKYGFEILRRKPWPSHPGGIVYELNKCVFNPDHVGGSAAFTLQDGKPGFRCQHNGCHSKKIRDVFELYPPPADDAVNNDASEDREAGSRRTQSQILVELAADAELFHTSDGEGFASLPVANHEEVWPLRSKACRQWLTHAFYKKFRKPPAVKATQDALALLEAKAQFDSPSSQVFTRIAPCAEGICVDLCNEKWEAVVISPRGWQIIPNPPVRFRRSKGMLALPYPSRKGCISELRSLINIGDDKNWILLLSWILSAYRPQGPYPVLIFQGEQGSAKSTAAKLVRKLIDPSSAPLRTPPREERDLIIAANNSWIVAYDNLSGIPHWLSDALCRLATGGGFSTRELYTDSDEVLFALSRPVILNGIDHLPDRADLADRAIILNLPRIDETARRDEAALHMHYEREHPLLLGALFDVMSGALQRLPEISLAKKPRMADFALYAVAAEEPLGFPSGAFLTAYSGNRAEASQETLESDAVSAAIVGLMDVTDGEMWTGTAAELLKHLETMVLDGVKKLTDWPKSPRALSGRLRRVSPLLRESGIEVTFHPKSSGGKRRVTILGTARDLTATTATNARLEDVGSGDRGDTKFSSGGG